MNEESPLLVSTKPNPQPDIHAPIWKIWDWRAPSHRFFLLFLACCIPFGGHFVKNSMSSLEQLMLNDPFFPITNTMYGGMLSAVSIPQMIIPFFGGALLDQRGHVGVLGFLSFMVIGQVIFTLAMAYHSYWVAILGRIIFGIAEGSAVVGARMIVAHWFETRELAFAMGTTVAMANVSKMLAKASVVPVANFFGGGYVAASWYCAFVCTISLATGTLLLWYTRKLTDVVTHQITSGLPVEPDVQWLETCVRRRLAVEKKDHKTKPSSWQGQVRKTGLEIGLVFWLLNVLHVVFINVFHLFQNVSASYLYQTRGYSIVKAGIVTSLSHIAVIFAPAIGLGVDRWGGRMLLVTIASGLGILPYLLLLYTQVSPVVSMVLISVCLSIAPTLFMASIPLSVPSSCFGLAFGIIEVTDGIGGFVGNLLVGYVRDVTGDYTAVLKLMIGMSVLSFSLALGLWIYDRHHDNLLGRRQHDVSRVMRVSA